MLIIFAQKKRKSNVPYQHDQIKNTIFKHITLKRKKNKSTV